MTEHLTYEDFFPYSSMREGQENMMQVIDSAVRQGQHICCEAPNGFGKTCVTLSGILPWILENDAKILYCARTHRQLDRAIEELSAMGEDSGVSGVSFRGRSHMCLNPFVLENAGIVAPISEVCGQLKASRKCTYYERVRNQDPESLLESMPSKVMSAPDIVKFGKIRKMCPYEIAKKLAKVVDLISLSYLYVFDPFILSTFMPELETPMSNVVLVQDEAHNVPTTALDSASDSLTINTIRQAMREGKNYNDEVAQAFCKGLAKSVIDLSTELKDNEEIDINPIGIYNSALDEAVLEKDSMPLSHLKDLGLKIKKGLLKAGKFPRSTIYRVAEFMLGWVQKSERPDYAFMLSSSKGYRDSKKISLDLVALDPTAVTSPILGMVRSSVAISGTISPLNAYAEMLGFGSESMKESFRSPFASKNRLGIIVEGLDTSYKMRSDAAYQRMVEHCASVANATPGNTGIFTTSYFLAKNLLKSGLEKKLERKLFMEKQGMRGTDNDEMIQEFKARSENEGAILLGVQGGRNSEGGDFPGATMESVVVVGVPYARPTPRIDALIKYYDKKFNNRGRDYAYVLPAVTRAIQSAGRPVRRLDDRGVIVLLDQRFATPYLKRFMPSWLNEVTKIMPDDPEEIAKSIQEFFVR
ncbi:MAG: helicase C-terminal domain-containing protein [Candidatus Thorarchaeota archaeon]